MNYLKKTICISLIVLLMVTQAVSIGLAATSGPDITAESAIIYRGGTGEVLWEKNADKKMEPASMVKLLTCLIAVEKLSLNDTVTITKEIEDAVKAASDKLLETITFDITELQNKLSDLNKMYHEL